MTNYLKKAKKLHENKPKLYVLMGVIFSSLVYIYSILIQVLLVFALYFAYNFTLKADKHVYSIIIFSVVAIGLIYLFLKITFIRNKKIKGIGIDDREKFEDIWNLVNSLTKEFKGIPINHIVLVDKPVIDILCRNKYVLFGKRKTYLIIGMPFLIGFSKEELETAIALSICKNSKKQSKFKMFIRRTYLRMENIVVGNMESVKTSTIYDIFIKSFYKAIYIKYKEYVSFTIKDIVLMGDKLASFKYSHSEIGDVLLKKYIKSYLIDNIFMKEIHKKLLENETPPNDLFDKMNVFLNENIYDDDIIDAIAVLKDIDKDTSTYIGSVIHRLDILDYDIDKFEYEFGKSSAGFVHKYYEKILNKFNKMWKKYNKESWEEKSKIAQGEKEEYDKLCTDFLAYKLDEEEFINYLNLREKFSGVNTAIIEGKKLCLAYPNNIKSRLRVGSLLLKGDNLQGIEYIKSAMDINIFESLNGYEDIINYYNEKENYSMASIYEEEYKKVSNECKEILKLRSSLSISSENYSKVDLDKENLLYIRDIIKKEKNIKSAYILKKDINKFKETSHYILLVDFKIGFFAMEETRNNLDMALQKKIAIENLSVIHMNGDNSYIKLFLKNIPKCKIYRKKKRISH